MKFFYNIFKHTLLYKLYATIYWFIKYVKDYNFVADSFYSDAFKTILFRYLNVEFSSDWLGRLYSVINPHIDINGKFNISNTIIEFDDSNTNSKEYVKNWIYRQMSMVNAVFRLDESNFFDYIGVSLKHVGPKNHDNYLVIFDIVSRKEFASYFKKATIHSIIYILLFLLLFYLNNLEIITIL